MTHKNNYWKFYRLLVSFLLLLTSNPLIAEEGEIDFLYLENELTSVFSLSGKFSQIYYDAIQDKKTEATGIFSFLKPAYMRWEYTRPEPYTISIGTSKIWLYDPILETVVIRNIDQSPEISTLFYLMDPGALSRNFVLAKPQMRVLEANENEHIVYLAPKSKDAGFSQLHVSFGKDTKVVSQFVIFTANQSYRRIALDNLKVNSALTPGEFEFVIPEGIEVIDHSIK